MKKLLMNAVLAVGVTGAALAQTATTQPAPAQGGHAIMARRAGLRQRLMKNLNLTEAQKTQAKDIFNAAKTAAQPVRTQLQQDRKALATAVKANDTAQIQQTATAIGAVQGQLVAIRSGAMAKFYAILTPDQQAKAQQMHQRLMQRIGRRARPRTPQTNG